MKPILCLSLFWALCSTAEALDCQTCVDSQCNSTVSRTCTTETMCVTSSSTVTISGNTVQQIFKACASSILCPASGNQTLSLNLGFSSTVVSAFCCNTDNCNSGTLPFPGAQLNNTLRCFSCNNATTSECTTEIQCRGVEDRCFTSNFTVGPITTIALGCASRNVCAAAENLDNLIEMQGTGNVSTETRCCSTNLCNSVTTISAGGGIIPLLLGLLVFTLY